MELFLVKIVALLRPIASIEYGQQNLFDLAGIGLFVLLAVVFLTTAANRRTLSLSSVDLLIVAFAVWCLTCYLAYVEEARIRDVAKLLIPLFSYSIVKNVITRRDDYQSMLLWMVVGFAVPIIASTVLILTGRGVDYVSFWTGVSRWSGAYYGSHSLGHSMVFFLFVLVLYRSMLREKAASIRAYGIKNVALLGIGALALFCLYMSQTRSAILGLIIFSLIYLFFVNRRLLILGGAAGAVIAVLLLPKWLPALLPDIILLQQGKIETSELGSGRPQYWHHNFEIFLGLPLDKKIAGVGIGNKSQTMHVRENEVLDSHNDWLDLLMQTGIIGFLIYGTLQVLILRAILRVADKERYFFLAVFIAASIMMFVSNSYIYRIAVCQTYYMMMAFIEMRRTRTEPSVEPIPESPPPPPPRSPLVIRPVRPRAKLNA